MNEEQARAILGSMVMPDNSLYDLSKYLCFPSHDGDKTAHLDGYFTADELEAIAWWMRNKETTS